MKRLNILLTGLLLGLTHLGSAHAAIVTYEYSTVFSHGSVAPHGATPYATAVFDDEDVAGSVLLTISVAPTVGTADLARAYFNINPAYTLPSGWGVDRWPVQVGDWTITRTDASGNLAWTAVGLGRDNYRADGDGIYDLLFDFPPPPGNNKHRLSAGESVTYLIEYAGLTALDFFHLAEVGGPHGPFYTALHFINTGPYGHGRAWVAGTATPVPLPGALVLLGSALLAGWPLRRRLTRKV